MVLRVNRLFWSEGEAGIQRFEKIVARHDAAGFDSELQVRYHPAAGDEGNLDAWAAYVRHVVSVFGPDPHVVAMTITNEVNLDVSQNTSDGAYARATDALTRGIVAARAEADRIGRRDLKFGFTYAYRWNPASDATFWTTLAGAGPAFRRALGFVGVDLYPGTFYPPVIGPMSSAGQELVKGIATVRRCFMPKAKLGARVPIWITENGFQSGAQGDDAGQAAALKDMVASAVAVSGTYGVSDYRWFNLRDNLTGSAGIFDTTGLLHDDYSPKPAFAALRDMVAAHGAAKPAPCVFSVTFTLPKRTRGYSVELDGRRIPGQRHGRRVTVTFRHAGRRYAELRAHTPRGMVLLGRTVTACRPAHAAAAPPPPAHTVVTLEFDVATSDQVRALPLLARYGMQATFFVNSGFIGQLKHLTYDQLRVIQAAGHEIAGQTIHHARLTKLSARGVRHEVCDDRGKLLSEGLAVDAFAYPFGAYSDVARDAVLHCGYTSARLASGVASIGKHCPACPAAETIPPRNRFATRMPAAAKASTPVSRIIDTVARAQDTGGGWIQILMHHVCHRCHPYAIATGDLAQLLAWLHRRRGVEIKTVSQLLDRGGPTISIAAPPRNWSGNGRIAIRTRFQASQGVRRIRFFADGREIGEKTVPPWRWLWDTSQIRTGHHVVQVLLEDKTGNAAVAKQLVFLKTEPPAR
ncbi:MAG: hypothetical protein QOG68_349 [Solirubrobacteraceae bacterium]|nr:hypothetical protein [Solirubrobacteraceae bacterium]